MGMVVQHNMTAANANRNLGVTCGNLAKSTEKLSSGYKINRAGDNAAGLAISEKMRGQIRGLDKASANAEDGISMIQTAEGALTETHSILQRMRELAVQSSSDTNTDDDRTQIQNEIDQLTQEVDRIATTTEFNTKKLLDGSRKGSVSEKDGTAKVDSTFANSTVSAAITTDNTGKTAYTDAIRVEFTADFTEGQSTKSTTKLSEADITNINNLITTSAAVKLPAVLQDGDTNAVSITGAGASTNSTDENISAALSATKSTLIQLNTAASTASTRVESNNETIDKTMSNIMKFVQAAAVSTGETALKEGTTSDDIKAALQNLVDAYVKDGESASGKASGDSDDIIAATTALKDLFSSSDNKFDGASDVTATYTLTEEITDGADATFAAKKNAVVTKDTTKMSEVAKDITNNLEAYAKALAGAEIAKKVADAKVDQVQDVVDVLSDKELATAIVDYKKAEKEYTSPTGTPTAEKKAELKEKMDAAKAKLDSLNKDKSVMTVTDLFGSSEDLKKFEVSSAVDKDNNLTINLKNKSGDDTVITIANADKIKAGDVVTITAKEMVETEQAATGKEAFRLQVGANAGQEVALGINSMKAKDLNIVQTKEGVEGKALDVTTQAGASLAINAYDMAIQSVSTERAKMGAMQNRLEHTIANLDTSSENLQSAESSLRDTDMAEEMTRFSKNNILQQAGQSMLAQANQSTQGVLSLLG